MFIDAIVLVKPVNQAMELVVAPLAGKDMMWLQAELSLKILVIASIIYSEKFIVWYLRFYCVSAKVQQLQRKGQLQMMYTYYVFV